MPARRRSPGKVVSKRRPKTYVFPYEALTPILNVNSQGTPVVTPLSLARAAVQASSPDELKQILETLKNIVTREDHLEVLNALEELKRNGRGPMRSEEVAGQLRDMELTLNRLAGVEEEIVAKLEKINGRIAELSSDRGLSVETHKEVIAELQRMERELLDSLAGVKNNMSRDIGSRVSETSERLTQFMIALDELKASLIQEIRNVRGVCVDGREIETLLEKSDQRALDRINEILRNNAEQLSTARREDTQRIRDQIEGTTASSSKADIQELLREETRTLETMVEEMKRETRSQIDRILLNMTQNGEPVSVSESEQRETENMLEKERLNDSLRACESRSSKNNLEIVKLSSSLVNERERLVTQDRELTGLKIRIRDLEQELQSDRSSDADVQKIEALTEQLETLRGELRDQTERSTQERVIETGGLQRELLLKQQQLAGLSEQLETALRDLKNISITEESYNVKLTEYNEQKRTLESLERQVASILRTNGREVVGDVTYGRYNLEALESYIITLRENVRAVKQNPASTEIPTRSIPRYAVIRKGKELIDLVDLDKPDVDFSELTKTILDDLYVYSTQISTTYETIRRAIYDNEYVFYVRSNLVKTLGSSNVDQFFSEYEVTPIVIEDETEKRELGRFVLTDVFSPFVDPNVTTNANIVVASGVMKVFSYGDAMDLAMSPFDGYFSKQQLAATLKRIFRSAGREIAGEKRILYDTQDLFTVMTFLIDEAKTYVTNLLGRTGGGVLRRENLFSLEVRMIIIDSFIKASLEIKNALGVLKSFYGSRNDDREIRDQKLLTYVRVRADGNAIDPRVSILLNSQIPGEARTKLQISHQPYVIPSLVVNDADTPYYQHDVFGPFTRVFLPNETNADIAGDVPELVNALNAGKDVCTVSIGPSGSGKTSTLLYFRGSADSLPSKGVMPTMMGRLDQRFKSARVMGYEMTANYQEGVKNDYWRKYDVFKTPVTFLRKDSDWIAEGFVEVETFSYNRDQGVCEREKPFENIGRIKTQFRDTSIGDFMSKLIDIRLNCGTPLNPVSSRSHLFLFIKFISDDGSDSPNLIVADLAGRERMFDCGSEGILELFSLNRYYPSLNQMINDPLGTAQSNPMFDLRRSGKFPKEGIHTSLLTKKPVTDIITPLAEYPLLSLFTDLHLDAFFPFVAASSSTRGEGYVLDKTGKDVSNVFYKFLGRVCNLILEGNYHEGVVRRLISIDTQPLELRNLLQKLDNQTTVDGLLAVVRYFARTPIASGTNVLSGRSQFERLGELKLGGSVLKNTLELMPTYINSILLVNYLSDVLKDKPSKVCGYRNVEGEFINRSLDEISNLIMLAAATDNRGPKIHPECLPISCSFAGLDCLLPKNVPRTNKDSALSQILREGTGRPSFRLEDTVFCTFVVLNFTKKEISDPTPIPLYDSVEPMLMEVYQAFDRIKKIPGTGPTSDKRTSQKLFTEFSDMYRAFLNAYTRESEIIKTHGERLNYRGMDPRKMITDGYLKETFIASKSNWMAMRKTQEAMLNIIRDRDIQYADSQIFMEMDSLVRDVKNVVSVVRVKNQNSSLGVLAFADDLVKRGLQPFPCSTFENRETVLESQVGWINAQYVL